jgi:hypothetical protein
MPIRSSCPVTIKYEQGTGNADARREEDDEAAQARDGQAQRTVIGRPAGDRSVLKLVAELLQDTDQAGAGQRVDLIEEQHDRHRALDCRGACTMKYSSRPISRKASGSRGSGGTM